MYRSVASRTFNCGYQNILFLSFLKSYSVSLCGGKGSYWGSSYLPPPRDKLGISSGSSILGVFKSTEKGFRSSLGSQIHSNILHAGLIKAGRAWTACCYINQKDRFPLKVYVSVVEREEWNVVVVVVVVVILIFICCSSSTILFVLLTCFVILEIMSSLLTLLAPQLFNRLCGTCTVPLEGKRGEWKPRCLKCSPVGLTCLTQWGRDCVLFGL